MALLGISIVNTVEISRMPMVGNAGQPGAAYWAYETLLHQRFFPIFSFLFGLSFGLFLGAAREQAAHPRLIMLARLGFLMCFGAIHRLLQPDEVLLTYGALGIVVLLPASFLPGRIVLALGTVATVAGVIAGGGVALIPGMLLLGLSAEMLRMLRMTSVPTRRIGVALLLCSVAALVLNIWQIRVSAESLTAIAALAGLATAGTYAVGLLLFLRSRVTWGGKCLANVGRMALTSYIGATVLILAANHFVVLDRKPDYGIAILLGMCVFVINAGVSTVWLRYARYGPLEWVWRCLTWWKVVPNRSRGPEHPVAHNGH